MGAVQEEDGGQYIVDVPVEELIVELVKRGEPR